MKRGKVVQSEGIELPNRETIKSLKDRKNISIWVSCYLILGRKKK